LRSKQLIAVILLLSGVIDLVLAFALFEEFTVRWVLVASAVLMLLLGGWFFFRGLNEPPR
jgi:ABC-type nickel/cobalt efflux system permease component RcnA